MGEEKYTQRVMTALQAAQQTAALHYHQEITSAHVLLALVQEPEGLLDTIFQEAKVDLPMLKVRLEQLLKKIPSVKGQDRLSMSVDMARVLGKAAKLAADSAGGAADDSLHCRFCRALAAFLAVDQDVEN